LSDHNLILRSCKSYIIVGINCSIQGFDNYYVVGIKYVENWNLTVAAVVCWVWKQCKWIVSKVKSVICSNCVVCNWVQSQICWQRVSIVICYIYRVLVHYVSITNIDLWSLFIKLVMFESCYILYLVFKYHSWISNIVSWI
jgi:hypothetical protein